MLWKELPVTIVVNGAKVSHVAYLHGIKLMMKGTERTFEEFIHQMDDGQRALVCFVARGNKPRTRAGKEMISRYFPNGSNGNGGITPKRVLT